MNKYSPLLFVMIFSFLFGDANVQIRLQNGQIVQGEFVGTYMNHVHILVEEKIIYYACDDITSITYSAILRFDYDCSINTVTADILFPPELDPMTGEMTQMLPDVFNPDIPKPAAKVEAGGVSTEQTVVLDNPKDLLYLKKKKDPAAAGMLSFFLNVSGSGHLYAGGGNIQVWHRSIPYSLAIFYFISQAEQERDEFDEFADDIYGDSYEPSPHLMIAVYAAYIGLIWDSVYMTKKYNIKLHNEIYDYEIKKVSELKQFESELKLRQAL